MKYSYFNTNRSGLSHIRNLGMYNNKTVTHIFKCHYAEGNPLCAVIFKPQESIQTWYWEDKEESIPCDYDIDYVKLMDDLRRRPRPKHWINGNRGRYYAPIKKGITSPIFYKSFPKIFESDYILYALPMLGYIGKGKDIDDLPEYVPNLQKFALGPMTATDLIDFSRGRLLSSFLKRTIDSFAI